MLDVLWSSFGGRRGREYERYEYEQQEGYTYGPAAGAPQLARPAGRRSVAAAAQTSHLPPNGPDDGYGDGYEYGGGGPAHGDGITAGVGPVASNLLYGDAPPPSRQARSKQTSSRSLGGHRGGGPSSSSSRSLGGPTRSSRSLAAAAGGGPSASSSRDLFLSDGLTDSFQEDGGMTHLTDRVPSTLLSGALSGEDATDAMTVMSFQTSFGSVGTNQHSQIITEQERHEELVEESRQLLDAVNMSIFPSSLRLAALQQASDYFDHRDRTQHDLELREGAANVMYQKLAFAVFQAGGLMDSLDGLADAVDEHSTVAGTDNTNVNNTNVNNTNVNNVNTTILKNNSNGDAIPTTIGGAPTTPSSKISTSTTLLEESDREIALITGCLEMVHRASSANVASAWSSIGYETLPLLVKVLERPVGRIERAAFLARRRDPNPGAVERAVRAAVGRDLRMSVQRITKLCAIYSLVPQAKAAMVECPGLLAALVRIVDTHKTKADDLYEKPPQPQPDGPDKKKKKKRKKRSSPKNNKASNSRSKASEPLGLPSQPNRTGLGLHMTEAARFNAIATLTNLAAAEPNRMIMLAEPGLVDSVARVVHNERSDVARQCAALAIMNLSNGDREHVPELAGNDLILETLLVLISDEMAETRRNAAVALFNVACADQNTIRLARYRDGAILEALSNLVVTDDHVRGTDDDEARTNAAETLFNMSCSEMSETTNRMADHYGLLENLALTLRSPLASIDVKMYCAATLRRMAEIIHAPKPSQGALLTALVKASGWTRTPCIAEAFLAQAETESNRAIVAQHHGLLNGLSKLALCASGEESDRVRRAAVTAIELLSREISTRRLLAQNEGIMMALTRASYGTNPAATVHGASKRGAGLGLQGRTGSDDSIQRQAMMQQQQNGGFDPMVMMQNGGVGVSPMSTSNLRESRRIRIALKNLVAAM